MSFKAAFDIAINFSYFKIKDFHKVGYLNYKCSVYSINRQDPSRKKKYAFPVIINSYNAQKSLNNTKMKLIQIQSVRQSYIDSDQTHYISRVFPVNYINRNFTQNNSCYFKIYIDVQIIEKVDFYVQVELIFTNKDSKQSLFRPQFNFNHQKQGQTKLTQKLNLHQTISIYKGKINKSYDIFSYLPICFDQFESIYLNGFYHAIISQFKFTNQQQQQNSQIQEESSFIIFRKSSKKIAFNTFQEYLSHITHNFLSSQIRTFLSFYRQFLINTYNFVYRNWITNHKLLKLPFEQNLNKADFNMSKKMLLKLNQLHKNPLNCKQFQKQKNVISELILEELNIIKVEIFKIWNLFNSFVEGHSIQLLDHYINVHNQLIQQRYKNNIFSHVVHQNDQKRDFTFSKYDDSGKSHIQQAKFQNRKNISESEVWNSQFQIENMSFIQNQQKNIKMFQQIYFTKHSTGSLKSINKLSPQLSKKNNQFKTSPQSSKSSQKSQKHIIFLVHGFGASKADLVLLKKFIQLKYNVEAVISTSNVGKTHDNIQKCGERLANQIKSYCSPIKQKFKLSFIGHSMGGLIIRSCLTKMQKFKYNLQSYISICTPHLGYLYQPSNLIKMGFWMLNKLQKADSLQQIQMKDNQDFKKCYLYTLARQDNLKHFKNIGFVSSCQDQYVPYESARVQKSSLKLQVYEQSQQHQRSQIIKQMVDNILRNLKADQISRIDVVFNIEQNNLQNFIGRTGHVKFLSDSQFIKQFVIAFSKYFQ